MNLIHTEFNNETPRFISINETLSSHLKDSGFITTLDFELKDNEPYISKSDLELQSGEQNTLPVRFKNSEDYYGWDTASETGIVNIAIDGLPLAKKFKAEAIKLWKWSIPSVSPFFTSSHDSQGNLMSVPWESLSASERVFLVCLLKLKMTKFSPKLDLEGNLKSPYRSEYCALYFRGSVLSERGVDREHLRQLNKWGTPVSVTVFNWLQKAGLPSTIIQK